MRFKVPFVICLALALAFLSYPTVKVRAKEAPACSAASAILYHPATGSVLYEKDADMRRPIASTTKIVTALTVLQNAGDLDRPVRIPGSACGIEGSSLYLTDGETLTVRELLYGLLLASANDAAAALAVTTSGSIESFADRMNETARELGLANSSFKNPHGLDDPDHYSTARDLVLFTAAALENETFREIVGTKRFSIPSADGGRRYLLNHNKLLTFLPDCVGIKTGFTKKSGRCLVGAAERDGELLISVTLNDPNDWNDHVALLEYGFASLKKTTLLSAGELVFDLPVVNGNARSVRVTNREKIALSLPSGASEPRKEIRLPRFLPAPIAKGQIVGYVLYELNGRTVGESPLVAEDAVAEIKYKKGLFHR